MAAFLSPTTYCINEIARLSRIICAVIAIFLSHAYYGFVCQIATMCSKRVVVL